jgi:hypothetical protein
LVSRLYDRGADIRSVSVMNVCVNLHLVAFQQEYLLVRPTVQQRNEESDARIVLSAMRDVGQRLFRPLRRHLLGTAYHNALSTLVEVFGCFRDAHQRDNAFPSETTFTRECVQEMLRRHVSSLAEPIMLSQNAPRVAIPTEESSLFNLPQPSLMMIFRFLGSETTANLVGSTSVAMTQVTIRHRFVGAAICGRPSFADITTGAHSLPSYRIWEVCFRPPPFVFQEIAMEQRVSVWRPVPAVQLL